MKITFFTHDFDGGGAARSLFVLVKHLVLLGHEIKIVTFKEPNPNKQYLQSYIDWKVFVFLFQWAWLTGDFKNLSIDMKKHSKYRDINKGNLHIVEELSASSDVVCFNGYPSASLAANISCPQKILIAREQLDTTAPRYKTVAGYLARHITRAVAISPAEAKQLDAMGIENEVIFNAAPVEPCFAPLPELPLRLGVFGQIYHLKGQRTLVEACGLVASEFRRHKATVHIYGGSPKGEACNPEQEYLQHCIDYLKINDIVFLEGWVDDVEKFMKGVHWIVRPDHDGSPWGRDVLEAMSVGRPVLASGVDEFFVKPGKNGFLVPPRDAQLLAKILSVILKDAEAIPRYAEAAFAFAREQFNPLQQTQKFVNFLNKGVCV